MSSSTEWRRVCHQCFASIVWEEVAHLDLYSDLCWIQCTTCEAAFGTRCGIDRKANPNPHGYFACPYGPGRTLKKEGTSTSTSWPGTRASRNSWTVIRGDRNN